MSEDRNKNLNVFNLDLNTRNTQSFPINNLNFNPAFSNVMNMPHNFNQHNYNVQFMNGKRHRDEIIEKSKIKSLILGNIQNLNENESFTASNPGANFRRNRNNSDCINSVNSLNSPSLPSTPVSTHNKQVLVKKIIENLKKLSSLEEIKDHNELKNISDNLKKFTIEDYSKFFQVMSNIQHISNLDSDLSNGILGKSKDIISINEKFINYNPDNLDLCLNDDKEEFSRLQQKYLNINKLIIRKEIPLKNLLKDKFNSIFSENSQTTQNRENTSNNSKSIITSTQNIAKISLNIFYEDLLKSIKKDKIEDNNQIQNMIRIHSQYFFNNGIIKFDKEDKLFLDFIIENFLSKDKLSNFYLLCKFWLIEDFLNYEKDFPIIYLDEHSTSFDNVNIPMQQLKRRYDSVLSEILNRIQTHKDLFEISAWIEFIETLPRINHAVIDHVLYIHHEIFSNEYEEIKKKCLTKKPLTDTIPHLKLIKTIYQKLKKPSISSNKILSKMLELPKFPDSHLITSSINFIMENFYSNGKYEMEKIKEHAIDQFRELLKISEKTPNPEGFIKSRFPLFFRLIRRDKELFFELPDVYSDSMEIVRNSLDKYLPRVLEIIDTYHAEKLISKCGEKCIRIVLEICEGNLFKPENFLNRKLAEDKLFRKIKNYFFDYESSSENILVALADKIPIGEFFTKENFIWEKIKEFDNKNIQEDLMLKIFNKINLIKSEEIYKDLTKIFNSSPIDQEKKILNFDSFSDKVMLHILYYFIFNNIKLPNELFNFIHFKNELSIFLKYYKLISSGRELENFKEFLNVIGSSQVLKRNENIEIVLLVKFVQGIFEIFYSENTSGNANVELAVDFLREYLNSIMQKENNLSDFIVNELISLIKKLPETLKSNLLKNLTEKVKNLIRAKDFILFSDL